MVTSLENQKNIEWPFICLEPPSLPGFANFALKSTANDYESEFGVAAADCLRNDFYVDDGLKSVPSIDEAVTLISDVKQMCKSGGFNLHKFVSNSKDVIRRIPESDKADGVKELDLDLDSLPLERALGVQWCMSLTAFSLTSSYRTSHALEEEYFL